MITIAMKRGYQVFISDEDSDLTQYKWHPIKGDKYAASLMGKDKTSYMHRVILARILGRPLEKGELVDHIDGNGHNNVRSNLRLATRSENARNTGRFKNNTTGYKGVSKQDGRFVAQICLNYKTTYLGCFETAEEAHEAYKSAAAKYHGEFANTGEEE